MPNTTTLIDALREAFGKAAIDRMIARGIKGEPDAFHALEAGLEVGTAWTWPAGVSVSDMPDKGRGI